MSKVKTPYVIGELIENRSKRNGDRVFLCFKEEAFTYNDNDINRYANRCANAFLKRG